MATLNINEFPLTGHSLIEASAGTGKTYTLSKLYMRFILGHQIATPANIKQLLVVTFTNAATEELRGRIRSELRTGLEAIEQYQQQPNAPINQDMRTWLEDMHLDKKAIGELKYRLMLNLNLMDEASIYTIHAFCQRLLVRFALDSQLNFAAQLTFDVEPLLRLACEDTWRELMYPLTGWQEIALNELLGSPQKLQTQLSSLWQKSQVSFFPKQQTNYQTYCQEVETQFQHIQSELKKAERADIASLIELYCERYELSKKSFNKNSRTWIEEACTYFQQDNPLALSAYKNIKKLGIRYLQDKGCTLAESAIDPIFIQIQNLIEQVEQLTSVVYPLVYQKVQTYFTRFLAEQHLIDSQMLLQALYQTLQNEAKQGQNELACAIRREYPYALIDEFQDTDDIQYGIFNYIYPAQDKSDNHALIMIGDPKQAIYKFRGADIYTYLQAKTSIALNRQFHLSANWRSHPNIIAGLNYMWQKPRVFMQEDIDYQAVEAGLNADKNNLIGDDKTLSGLHIIQHKSTQTTAEPILLEAADACAAQIKALLNEPASLDNKPLQAGDIAVLVRSKKQAALIYERLKKVQINSVLTSSEQLFASNEAKQLFIFLQALSEPNNERLVRQSMSCELQQHLLYELEACLNSEQALEAQLNRYLQWQRIWQQSGVMAMLMDWLNDNQRGIRLSKQENSERRLTNLLHLGELLEQQGRKLNGQKRLLFWFKERILHSDKNNEEYSLRLESDANLVQISTIHTSKGLQYPVVFLPFLWADAERGNAVIREYHHHQHGHIFDTSGSESSKKAQFEEEQRESMRLLYVAMTRACAACFVQLWHRPDSNSKNKTPKSQAKNAALGRLLGLDNIDFEQLDTWFNECQKDSHKPQALHYHRWQAMPQAATANLLANEQQLILGKRIRALDLSYKLSSFSYLIKDEQALRLSQNNIFENKPWQSEESSTDLPYKDNIAPQPHTPILPIAQEFTKGAHAGTCLHSLLELWDFQNQEALLRLTQQQLNTYALKHSPEAVADWLKQVVNCPLKTDYADFSLAQIEANQRLNEMEFYLPVAHLSSQELNLLLQSPLDFAPFKGHLKGFIDLVFCYQGRYYIADYKSNYLGDYQHHYHPNQLQQVMHQHHYDLQAKLYQLALDRLLQQRLPNYQAGQHLGGVLYLFIRAMQQGTYAVHYQAPNLKQLEHWRHIFKPADPQCKESDNAH